MTATRLPGEPGDSTKLTVREREVQQLVRAGYTNNEIAEALAISRDAVRYHLKEIHSKYSTGGDRVRLRSLPTWVPSLGLLRAALASPVAPVAGLSFLSIGLVAAAIGAYARLGPDPSSDDVAAIAGRYPNGCPDSYSAWPGATLADFEHVGGASLDELRRLNPALGDGPLPAGSTVFVPYDQNGTCGEATMTPPGSTRPAGVGSPSPSADHSNATEVQATASSPPGDPGTGRGTPTP